MKKAYLYHSNYNNESIVIIAYSPEEAITLLMKELEIMSRIIKDDYILYSSCKCELGESAVASIPLPDHA